MAQKGTGATITFASGFFAEVLDVAHRNLGRDAVPTSHMGTTGGRTYLPSTSYEPGELAVELAYAPETAPPFADAAETCTLTMVSAGTGGTSTIAGTAFLMDFEARLPWEERAEATAVLKFSGDLTYTP